MISMNLSLYTAAQLAAGAEFLQRLALTAPASVPANVPTLQDVLTSAKADKLEAELEQHHDETGVQPPAPVEPHTIEAPAPAKRRGRPPKAKEAEVAAPAATVEELVATVGPDVASEPPPVEVTVDDVRAAMGEYVKQFGMAAAQEDGPALLRSLFGADVAKISAIPADGLQRAHAAIVQMTAGNTYKRAVVS